MKFFEARSKSRRAERWLERADLARSRGNWVEAARAYKEILTLAPTLTAIWVQCGHALKESGARRDAEQAYRMAIAQNGKDADAHLQLGHLLKLEGRPMEAAGEYCAAALLNPAAHDAHRELAALGYVIADDQLQKQLETAEQDVTDRRAELAAAADARCALERQLDALRNDLLEAQELIVERGNRWTAAEVQIRTVTEAHEQLCIENRVLHEKLVSTEHRIADLEGQNAAVLSDLAILQRDLADQRERAAQLEERAVLAEARLLEEAEDEQSAADASASSEDADIRLAPPELIAYGLDNIKNAKLRKYASTGYTEIDGWGINDYLIKLFLSLNAYQGNRDIFGNLFEIGVFHGRVLILLGMMSRTDERVVGLDIFEALQSHNIDLSGGYTTKEIVEHHLDRYRLREKTELIVGDSLFTDLTKVAALSNLRFAHIDGAHYVDAVVNDLMKTQQQMVPGGIIVVDDFLHVGFPGVNEGCHRFLSVETPRLVVPFAAGANKLFLTTHSHHADLLDYMHQILIPPNGKPIKIHGFDAVSLEPG